ncbi:uncharacterized protein LOC110321683 [Mus pahari]|uniref:uncharacterized protein LOC110321683 n=1 Tax=Mus pahari TaxID=10093 RepID=UPI000A3055FA|nr:uncharacterized protein LOC110321683 [Mus pahari]
MPPRKPGLLPSMACGSESQPLWRKPPTPPPPPPPRSPQLWAPGGARASRAEGGGRREDGRRWPRKGVGSRACETPRAPPGSTSSGSEQTRHKGGSRRSCQSEALPVTGVAPPPPPPPLSLGLSSRPLSGSGLWCSAGGGGGGGGGAPEPHCACAPAAPPGPAPHSQACWRARPSRGVSGRGARGREGLSWGGQPGSLSSHTRTSRTWTPCDLCKRVRGGRPQSFV